MTDKKNVNDFNFDEYDFSDPILSKDFNSEDAQSTKQDIKAANNLRENVIKKPNTINEKEVEKRAIAQAAFLAAREAEKKRIEDRLYLELRIVVETVKEYCEENDRIHWFEYILPTFTTLNKYGNRRNTEIMHELGNLITDITYKHGDDLHQVMPSKDALYIKLFASFIIDIAAGKL
ncbi:MAG: hypothetical protein ACN6PK_05955 [Pseudomonas shirazensis]